MSDSKSETVERTEEPLLDVSSLCKSLVAADGSVVEVSRDITFSLTEGEFVSIVGPSGAGKTTLLRAISGLTEPDRGTVRHRGEVLTEVPGWLSIVFQEYNKTLFPWLSVSKNVMLAVRSLAKADAKARTMEALGLVGLSEFAGRYPWELSGGMQQRVALARAMVSRPELLMMDEPFASVDALTRGSLEDMVQRLWAEGGFTALLVTHDIGEAVYLSDRVLVLSARPSTVLTEIDIDLPRPRNRTTRALPRFHDLTETVLSYIEHRSDAGDQTTPDVFPLPEDQAVSST